MVRVLFLFLLFISTPLSLSAATSQSEFLKEEETTVSEKRTPLDSKALLIKTVLLLAGIVSMLYGGAYFVKRMGGGKYASAGSQGDIQLIERKFLSPKTSVWLLSIKKAHVVVVEGQNGVAVHLLKPSSEKEIV